jgi:hypothetical protein
MSTAERDHVARFLDKAFLVFLGGVLALVLSHCSRTTVAAWVVVAMACGFGSALIQKRFPTDRPLDGEAALLYRTALVTAARDDPQHYPAALVAADAAARRFGYLVPDPAVSPDPDDHG